MTGTNPEHDIIHLADEYVLGLMEPMEAAVFEVRLERDAELRAAVEASRDRFLPLDATADPLDVPEELWQRIDAGISAARPTPEIATAPSPAASNDNIKSGWRWTAMASLAATVLLAVTLGWSLLTRPDPVVIAVLLDAKGEAQAIVEDFGNEQATVKLLADFTVPEGKTLQVWTLPSQDMGPVSLGLLENSRSAALKGPALPKPQGEQLYEITLETAGGSPTGRPTGPILVKGFAKAPR
ncbi:anti-sigma factor [Rhizobium sp. CG4]|uniref:anti-sigma factor n=1 Tax=Rhizobium sp. CG4 TaxID=2726075 RepID=UPI0020336091|nr:anti-sigma factor [Rhizobium sp. CG4]MCM2455178.1 anti-sigma factor [Rhizobium sp. CG4]